ncbi:histidine kinase [Sphingopyxis sp. CCNWLW253]|uniref:histidine kinase n=1 Tax=unclassified Sphingopyxis TaxID=2614943 RepID=UPI003012B925
MDRPVVIVASDPALLSSLRFALSVEGFDVREADDIAHPGASLVVDQDRVGGGLALVAALRAAGNSAPVILLVTHPDRNLRTRAKLLGVELLEKPLQRDDLSRLLATSPDPLARAE